MLLKTQFIQQYLPQYFLLQWQPRHSQVFLDFQQPENFYVLCSRLIALLSSEFSISKDIRLLQIYKSNFVMSYETVKCDPLDGQGLGEVLQAMSSRLKYHEVLMAQLLFRLGQAYLTCEMAMNSLKPHHIEEFKNIYQLCKVTMSIDSAESSLPEFLNFIFDQLLSSHVPKSFDLFVRTIMQECRFNEKLKLHIEFKLQAKISMFEGMLSHSFLHDKAQKTASINPTKLFQNNIRRKIAHRHQDRQAKPFSAECLPTVENSMEDISEIMQSPMRKILEMKKLQKLIRKPVPERTIYLKEKNTFQPKKCLSFRTMTSSLDDFLLENSQITEKKWRLDFDDDISSCLAEETPKPRKKQSLCKTQDKRYPQSTLTK